MANGNLQPRQFGDYTIKYDGAEDNTAAEMAGGGPDNWRPRFHSMVAFDSSGNEAGSLAWGRSGTRSRNPGEIGYVHVQPEHRGNGLASAMYEHAASSGIRPSPKHSPDRTDAGDGWAKRVGGRVPRRSNWSG